jgi:phage repressor protein C with HTH and peptisase S24 domain
MEGSIGSALLHVKAILATKKQTDSPDNDFVNIPRFSDKISAGGGLVPINDVDIKVAFRRDWIEKKGSPEKMSLIAVSGDSMEPTLMPRDLVLINHDHNHLDPQGGIYAIALDDVILIKRLQILYPSGKVRIISDNSKYDSFELSQDEVKINGRVIWFGREL